MLYFCARLVELNKKKGWNYTLATCGEAADLDGIEHNHCIDDALIIRRAYNDAALMRFLKAELHQMPQPDLFGETPPLPDDAIILDNGMYVTRGNNRDKGQREFCGCMKSKDIGEYNTCIHLCEYCYANTSKEAAIANYKQHNSNQNSETITGR